ncbi:LL-diaminopimelate aminotransferase [Planctomycetota bacterium]|nr:LL-diaminopimelate aminotransferase [Planctomycetota bacterium]
MNPALRALKPYPMAQLEARKAEVRKSGRPLFDFGTGDPVEPTAPFLIAALREAVPAISQYPSVAGTPALRSAVAGYLRRRFAVTVDPATQVLPSAGSKEAIFHLALAFLDPASGRDLVVYGTPGYPVYQSGALFAGGQVHPVVLDAAYQFRLELDRLPREVLERTAIAWINYPHNPTGACVDRDYLRRQADVAKRHGILLASDECYQDLWFDGESPPPSLLEVATSGVLVFHSCSKRSGLTGYRTGFIAGDPALIAGYRSWRVHMGVGSPAFVEAAGAAAWSNDDHAAERRRAFAAKRDVLVPGLAKLGIAVLPTGAGLYLWAKVPGNNESSDAYCARLLDAGIIASPGGFFGDGGAGWFRLALVPTVNDCRQALAVWPR